jgi:hypothetical protein
MVGCLPGSRNSVRRPSMRFRALSWPRRKGTWFRTRKQTTAAIFRSGTKTFFGLLVTKDLPMLVQHINLMLATRRTRNCLSSERRFRQTLLFSSTRYYGSYQRPKQCRAFGTRGVTQHCEPRPEMLNIQILIETTEERHIAAWVTVFHPLN